MAHHTDQIGTDAVAQCYSNKQLNVTPFLGGSWEVVPPYP